MTEYAWHEIDGRKVFRKVETYQPKRSGLPAPHVIGDTMDPVQSQLDGKLYTSKSGLRQTYREAGVVEVGNDPARLKPFAKKRPERKEIKASLEKAKARYERGERAKRLF